MAPKKTVKVNNSGYVTDRKAFRESIKRSKAPSAQSAQFADPDILCAGVLDKKAGKKDGELKPKKVSSEHVLDLEIGKLPTDTVHTLSKKSKYHEDAVYPNSSGPSRVIFNGPSGSGKTNFCLSLICDPKHMSGYFDKIFVFCPSAELQSDYSHLESRYTVGKDLEILDFNPAVMQAKWDEARAIFLECKNKHMPLPQTLFLFDDLINVAGFDKCCSTLMTKARHSGISVWVITQGFMTLSRLMRLQASNVFAFSPTESEIQRLADDCTNAICDEKRADKIIRHATQERFKPFHFNRHAPLHTQYRKGLTDVFLLSDPVYRSTIHTAIEEEEETKTNSNDDDLR